MSEIAEVKTEPSAWQASTWAPIGLAAVLVVLTMMINPMGKTEEEAPWGLLAMGFMFSAPLVCGLFAAWAPQPLLWRLPAAACVCGLLGLTGSVVDGDLNFTLALGLVFVMVWAVTALVRRFHGLRLSLQSPNAEESVAADHRQFSVRYLLAWTTITAVMLFLAKYIAADRYRNNSRVELLWPAIWNLLGFTAILSIALAPVITVAGVVLARQRLSPGRIALVPLSLLSGSLLASLAIRWFESPSSSETFVMTWSVVGQLCTGATLGMLLSAGVLRWAGYRLIRETASA